MIVITEKSRAALAALVDLAAQGSERPVPIVEVAERRGLALHVVEQLFGALRRAGILRSQRGMRGGYAFRRPAAEVTVLDVVEAVDGEVAAPDATPGGGNEIWREALDGATAVLGETTVADVARREAAARNAPMFHI